MKDLSKKFLTDSEQLRIIETVKKVELVTSGEIVPLIVSSSYSYPKADIIGAMCLSLCVSILSILLMNTENVWMFLAFFSVGFMIFHETVKRIPALKRIFISKSEIEEEVEEAALTSFYKHGLYRTRDETGVLIFISVFEKRVWVLADRGINEKVDPSAWSEIIDHIVEGIHKKHAADSICKAIEECGDILSTHFPIKHDDENELKNLIIE